MGLFSVAPTSYAEEQLHSHLVSLATLPVTVTSSSDLPSDVQAQDEDDEGPFSNVLQDALALLTQTTPPKAKAIAKMLKKLHKRNGEVGTYTESAIDRAAEAEILTRSVSIIWAEVLQVMVDSALALEDDKVWWERTLASRTGAFVYLVQSLPERIWRVVEASLETQTWQDKVKKMSWASLHMPSSSALSALFRPLHGGSAQFTAQLPALASPLVLTRREMATNRNTLRTASDLAATRVGILARQGPNWTIQEVGASATASDLTDEATRIYNTLCDVLNIQPLEAKNVSSKAEKGSNRKRRGSPQQPPPAKKVTPDALAEVVTKHLPEMKAALSHTLKEYGRPSALTRLWFSFLFLPPALYFAAKAVAKNKEWVQEQVTNARETIKGFFVQWVWEPVEDIFTTMRGGGEGLSMAPATVKADEESLQRMVVDFGRDVYHLKGAQLDDLRAKVESGDMESVLKAYENEIRQPIKSALFGHLVRTLLIQVQKTKTDLSVALQSLDQLLRSQQLTFAFVGVAPSVLVLYGVWGWLRNLYTGEKRNKGRRRRYFHSVRAIEALLLTAEEDEARMSDKDRGLLIVTTSGLRQWATGIGSSVRQAFLDDLRMFEDQTLTRGDKLLVVERIWRSWGREGRLTSQM